jgi:hypothetical protein
MKIYFSAPISRVSDEQRQNYQLIIEALKSMGHSVLSDHLGTNKTKDDIEKQSPKESFEVQRLMTKRKNQADIVVIEASTPSFGIGQEIGYSIRNNKQVIILYLPTCKPHILKDEGTELLFMHEYTPTTVKEVIMKAIDEAGQQVDVRFNFYISPEIGRYLDWVSQHKKLPRAVFLRSLLEKSMKTEKDFEK